MTWQDEWHTIIAPELPTKGLIALRVALETDNYELIQKIGVTHTGNQIRGCCAVAYPLWKSEYRTMPGVWYKYNTILLKETVFVSWYDKTPRKQAFAELLVEVNKTLESRKSDDLLL